MTRVAVAVALLVLTRLAAHAACGDVGGDELAVAGTRAAVESACPCASATRHGEYVRCAADVVNGEIAASALRVEWARAVRRCVRASTCGRPGAVTCCRTRASGETRCAVRRDASGCTAPRGGQACVGAFTSCCDACGPSGCIPASTSTTTTTLAACESGAVPNCNGTCGDGGTCGPTSVFPGSPCVCVPPGGTPGGTASTPVCGGACPPGGECQAYRIDTIETCACGDPSTACACGVPGTCPGDEWCVLDPPCGCGP
jgi:hypothetical protein